MRFRSPEPQVKERTFRFVWQCPFLLLRVIYCCYLREGEGEEGKRWRQAWLKERKERRKCGKDRKEGCKTDGRVGESEERRREERNLCYSRLLLLVIHALWKSKRKDKSRRKKKVKRKTKTKR